MESSLAGWLSSGGASDSSLQPYKQAWNSLFFPFSFPFCRGLHLKDGREE